MALVGEERLVGAHVHNGRAAGSADQARKFFNGDGGERSHGASLQPVQ
jgi:hypothetical protein